MSKPSLTSVAEYSEPQHHGYRGGSKRYSDVEMNNNRGAYDEIRPSREVSLNQLEATGSTARRRQDPSGDARRSLSDSRNSSGLGSSLNLSAQGDDCIYESPSTQIYCSVDTEGRYGPSDADHPIKIAIKLLFDPEPEEDDLAALFNEYNILMTKLANCGGVRRAIKQGKQDGFQAIFLEWAEGVSLSQWFTSRTAMCCPLLDRVQLARKICVALAEVHASGVVHRKVSADNIMVDCQPAQNQLDLGSSQSSFQSAGGTRRRRSRVLEQQTKFFFNVKLIDLGCAEVVPETGGIVIVDSDIFRDDLAAMGVVLGQLFGVADDSDDDGEGIHQLEFVPRSIFRLLDNLASSGQGAIFAGTYSSVKEVVRDIDYMLDEPETYLFDPHLSEEVMSILDEEDNDGEVQQKKNDADNGNMSDTDSVSALDDHDAASVVEESSAKSAASVTTGAERSVSSYASLYGAGREKDISQGDVEGLLVAGCSALTFVGSAGNGNAASTGLLVLEHATNLVRSLQESIRGDEDNDACGIEQDMVENLAAEGRYNFVWLTKSDALAKSLAGLADAIEPGGWFLAIFFPKAGDDDATTSSTSVTASNAVMSKFRSFVGMDGIPRNDERVAALLDPTGMFDCSTYKSKSVGDINVCVVQRGRY